MLTRRLTPRTPSAKRLAVGYVPGRRLTFDKVSQDGSGKCDAEKTDRETDRVYGVVFQIASSEEEALDKAEGYGKGYDKEVVEVVTSDGAIKAKTYSATTKEPILRPYRWYKALTVAGAVEHDLPFEYIEWLRTIDSDEDPDHERRKKNEAILFAS